MYENKELIQNRINELELYISSGRLTGKTYRAINKCIDEFFNLPIGSEISLIDNPKNESPESVNTFADKFIKRLRNDFPDVKFKIKYPKPGVAIVIRLSETYQELAKKRIEQWKNKLSEIK